MEYKSISKRKKSAQIADSRLDVSITRAWQDLNLNLRKIAILESAPNGIYVLGAMDLPRDIKRNDTSFKKFKSKEPSL